MASENIQSSSPRPTDQALDRTPGQNLGESRVNAQEDQQEQRRAKSRVIPQALLSLLVVATLLGAMAMAWLMVVTAD